MEYFPRDSADETELLRWYENVKIFILLSDLHIILSLLGTRFTNPNPTSKSSKKMAEIGKKTAVRFCHLRGNKTKLWSVQLGTGFGHIFKKTSAAFKPGMIG